MKSETKRTQERKYLNQIAELNAESNRLLRSTLDEIERRIGCTNAEKIAPLLYGLMEQSAVHGEVRHRLQILDIQSATNGR